MIRSVVLSLNPEIRWAQITIGASGQSAVPNRDHIWREWSRTLFCADDDHCLIGGTISIGFPALEKATLDFMEWQLTDSEGLLVNFANVRI